MLTIQRPSHKCFNPSRDDQEPDHVPLGAEWCDVSIPPGMIRNPSSTPPAPSRRSRFNPSRDDQEQKDRPSGFTSSSFNPSRDDQEHPAGTYDRGAQDYAFQSLQG